MVQGAELTLSQKNIDILVNAAGVTHYSPLFVTSPTLLEEVMRTNLMGTMMGCRTVGKNMMARKGGESRVHFLEVSLWSDLVEK